MIKHLYDEVAKRWYHNGGTIYFYGDPHFGDLDSYRLRYNHIKLQLEMGNINKETYNLFIIVFSDLDNGAITKEYALHLLDMFQINHINSKVHKNDTLVILGDVGDIECVKKLKAGYKVLIIGNHDKGASNYKKTTTTETVCIYDGQFTEEQEMEIEALLKKGYVLMDQREYTDDTTIFWYTTNNGLFDEVYEGKYQIGPKLLLSHEPIDDRYCLNIHGHTHAAAISALKEILHFDHISYQYDCIAEKHDYRPVSIKTLTEFGLLKPIDDIHHVTINQAKGG